MCRSNNHGGRRCPYGSSYAAKQRANANRKKNRRARKNLTAYFTAQGMDKTAELVKDMKPSAIPALLNEMGLGDKAKEVLGEEPPMAANVSDENKVDSNVLQAFAQEKGDKKFDIEESIETTSETQVESPTDTSYQPTPAESAEDDADDDAQHDYSAEAKEVLDTAVEESAESTTEDLLNTQEMGAEVTPMSKEEIAVGFAAFIKKNKGEMNGGIYKHENTEDLNELYRSVNKLNDVPQDRDEQQEYWEKFAKTTNEVAAQEDPEEKIDPRVKNAMDSMEAAEVFAIPKKSMMRKSVAKQIDSEAVEKDVTMNSGLKSMMMKMANQEVKVRDLGDNTYVIEPHSGYGETHILHAPNGLGDKTDMSLSRGSYYAPAALSGGSEIPKGLGLSGLSKEERKEVIRGNGLWKYVKKIGFKTVSKKDKAEALYGLNDNVEQKETVMDHKAIRDVRMAHNFANGNTFYHKETGVAPAGSNFNVTDLRHFHAGLSKTGEKTVVKKDFAKIYGNSADPFYGKLNSDGQKPTFNDLEESKKFSKILKENSEASIYDSENKAANLVYSYTGSGYSTFAKVAVSTGNSTDYSDEELKLVNDKIKEHSATNVKRARTVFRGQKVPYGMSTKQFLETIEVGDNVSATKILSTTSKAQIADDFNGGPLIYVYRTKQGAAVKEISSFEHENEILLPVGAEFTVVKTEQKGGRGIVYLADKNIVNKA